MGASGTQLLGTPESSGTGKNSAVLEPGVAAVSIAPQPGEAASSARIHWRKALIFGELRRVSG